MAEEELSNEILEYLHSITNKRAKIVIDRILEHGFITTEELKEIGYDHPPRAARDVREAGIPLSTFWVKNRAGKRIGAYRFGDLSDINRLKLGGRSLIPKEFKDELYTRCQGHCAVCNIEFEDRYLQADHKVPYEIAGPIELNPDEFQLLCGSCNRAKSWSCEHCINWNDDKIPDICLNCYWGNPRGYSHIALREIRRIDVFWTGNEVETYERLKEKAKHERKMIPDYVKEIVRKYVER